jgi:MSHA biogenesis protein MshG
MSRFHYTARGPHGPVQGTLEGASAAAVADELRVKGWVPLTIKADAPMAPKGLSAPVAQPSWMAPKVQPQDVMLFSKQLFTLIKAGVPLLRALNGLQETAINPTFKTVVGDLRRSLEAGVDLSGAMAQHPKVFDNFYVSMVRVGEASGQLEEVFKRLADHLQFEAAMRQQVKSAMRYPSFVIMAMAGAIGVINVMVIPSFAGVFKSMGAELPILTKLLVGTSNFTLDNGGTLVGVVAGLFLLWRHWKKTPQGRPIWDRMVLAFPLVGPIVTKAALSRFARAFSLSLRSGVPMERALTGVAQTADNAHLATAIESMKDRVMRGESLASSAASTGVFTPMAVQMIAIGEETGMLDDLLDEVGEMYNNDVQYALKTLSQQIEPILVVFMGGLVLVLALGVFLPMWNLGQVTLKH